MWKQQVILISVLLGLVSSDGMEDRRGEYRKPKLFTFNTVDEDVTVSLDFTVPFLTLPSKKVYQSAVGVFGGGLPSINVNPSSLAVGGAVVLATSVLVPLMFKIFALHHPDERYSRLMDSTEFSADAILRFAGEMLSDSRSVRGCALRLACWSAQRSAVENNAWHELWRNQLLSSIINATAVEDAMVSGRQGRDCDTYIPCPLKQEHLPMLIKNFAALGST